MAMHGPKQLHGTCKGLPQQCVHAAWPHHRLVRCSSSRGAACCLADAASNSEATSVAPPSSNVKLPRSHLTSSKRALEQLKEMQVNRYAGSIKPVLVSIGLTFHTAPLDLREKLAVPEAEWPRAIAELCQYPHIEEAAVLSTCNRMELYVVALSWHRGVREVEDWLCRSSGVPLDQLRPHLFLLRERDAAHHLMRVSGGLDSLVLGEGQILAQVRQVHKTAQKVPGFGRYLNGLFKQAISAGKRVRSETAISAGSVSVSSAAVQLAGQKARLEGASVLVVGAGKMGALLVKHLAARGCRRLALVNRGAERAAALAAEVAPSGLEVEVRPLHELSGAVEAADMVFTASGAEELLVRRGDVERMAPAPGGGTRRFFDISVPRNVAPDVASCTATELYNVDDLKEVVSASRDSRAAAAAEAETMVLEELRAFEAWRDSQGTVPTIKALRTLAEGIRVCEFERAAARLGAGSPGGVSRQQLAVVEELSRALVNKLLHGPMAALRCGSGDPAEVQDTLATMSALGRMFELGKVEAAAAPAGPSGPPR